MLKEAGIQNIECIADADRYETSLRVALCPATRIVIAESDNHSDANSISIIASNMGMPVLLTTKDSLLNSTKQYINGMSIENTYILGVLVLYF